MGTRGLTCVVLDGEYKVSQYGQWDHYPSGQGKTVLDFLKNKMDRDRFESGLRQTEWIDEETMKALWEEAGHDGSQWVNMEVSNKFKSVNPQLDRDMAAEVLEFIQGADAPVLLNDEIAFAQDGLFCEWCYVVDLDKNVLEVYSGFGKEKLDEGSRFGNDIDDNGYSAVGLVKSYDLDNLPDEETFIAELERDEDEEGPDETMTKDAVFATIDKIRNSNLGESLINDRICNYMEANIDEFLEMYEMVDSE